MRDLAPQLSIGAAQSEQEHVDERAPGKRSLTETMVRRQARDARGVAGDAPEALERAAGSGGVQLPEGLGARLATGLGADLGGVRLHTGEASAEAADALGARAFAVGQDIHFGAGEYAPGSDDGRQLIAHEVAHTVQQRGASDATAPALSPIEVSQPGDAMEREAEAFAISFGSERPAAVSAGAASSISRAIIQRAPRGEPPGKAPAGPRRSPAAELNLQALRDLLHSYQLTGNVEALTLLRLALIRALAQPPRAGATRAPKGEVLVEVNPSFTLTLEPRDAAEVILEVARAVEQANATAASKQSPDPGAAPQKAPPDAAMPQHRIVAAEEKKCVVILEDTNGDYEYLGQYICQARVARSEVGEVYPLMVNGYASMSNEASTLSFGADISSYAVRSGEDSYCMIRYAVKVAGPAVMETQSVNLGISLGSDPAKIGIGYTHSRAVSRQPGALFVREFKVRSGPMGTLIWEELAGSRIDINGFMIDDAAVGRAVGPFTMDWYVKSTSNGLL